MFKILIVEDQKGIAEGLEELLEVQGYTVLRAFSGKEALELVHKEKPQIILLDLYLNDMSGLKVLQEAKADSPKTCVIVLTGFDVETTRQKALGLGADYFLTKPLPWPVLKDYLAEATKEIANSNRGS